MCFACYQAACVGVTACDDPSAAAALALQPPGAISYVTDYTALLAYNNYSSARWNAMLPQVGAQVFVTYSFLETAQLPATSTDPYGVSAYWSFDAAQRASTRVAMAELSRVSGVVFVETTGTEAMLQVHGSTGSPYAGWAQYPTVWSGGASTGRMVIDMDGTYAPGTSAYQVILHELGHAVGLKHPFDGDIRLTSTYDTTDWSVMSYTWQGGNRTTYAALDVDALQHIYGAARANAGWAWGMANGVFTLRGGVDHDTILGVRTENSLKGGRGQDLIAGSAMNDTLYGGSGNDTLMGGAGQNRLSGGAGRDVLTGGSDADRMFGGDGHDTLTGDWGDDRLYGDAGDDLIHGDLPDAGFGSDRLYGGDGNDRIYGGSNLDTLYGGAGDDRLYGGSYEDLLDGGDGNDLLDGGDGRDTLMGGAGNDTVYGGDRGAKSIRGNEGDDLLYGASDSATFAGWDVIRGDAGNDRIWGRRGSDSLYGGSGDDTIHGEEGWDSILGGSGSDLAYGGADHDRIEGEAGNDILYGDAGRDQLYGGAGNDRLFGGIDNDDLYGGAGRDRLTGGAGTDYFRFTAEDLGAVDVILDFEVKVDRIVFTGLGYLRSSLSVTDMANGTDSLLTIGPSGEMQVQLAGVRAADFYQFDVWL